MEAVEQRRQDLGGLERGAVATELAGEERRAFEPQLAERGGVRGADAVAAVMGHLGAQGTARVGGGDLDPVTVADQLGEAVDRGLERDQRAERVE